MGLAIDSFLMGRRNKYQAREVGTNLLEYDCEERAADASREAAAIDCLLAEKAQTAEIERHLAAADEYLPATLARILRLFELLTPRRLLEMSRRTRSALKACHGHLNPGYSAVVRMSSVRLAEMEKTFELMREFLRGRSPDGQSVAKHVIFSPFGFPTAVFLDEATAPICLETVSDAPKRTRCMTRELFACLMLSDSLARSAKAAFFNAFKPYSRLGILKAKKVQFKGCLLGRDATFPDSIMGLSRPSRGDAFSTSPDYPMAVNPRLQAAFCDSAFVRRAYVKNKFAGHEIVAASFDAFAYSPGFKSRREKPRRLVSLADDSNPAYFKLMADLAGLSVDTVPSALALMDAGQIRCLAYIVAEHYGTMKGCLTPAQLLFHASTLGDLAGARELAIAVEKAAPGTAASAIDPFGNTPIWYLLHNCHRLAKEDVSAYVDTLISLGCNPNRLNNLGLCYNDVSNLIGRST